MDIPKIIHYVWLGSGKMSPFIQDCVDSWKRVMPDYEIKCSFNRRKGNVKK